MARITELVVFPIKSCRGISTQAVTLTHAGLKLDRQWMVVKAVENKTGHLKFMTIRQEPKLTLVIPSLPEGVLTAPVDAPVAAGAVMTVTAEGQSKPLLVPLAPPKKPNLRPVEVWEWKGLGHDEGDEAAAWFSAFLGWPARLVRYMGSVAEAKGGAGGEPVVRPTDAQFADGGEVRFVDNFPVMLATEGSLADVNARLAAPDYKAQPPLPSLPIPMSRYRPNIVVGGTGPWEEDKWGGVRVALPEGGSVEIMAVKPCDRCNLPTVDPETAQKSGGEPYDILTTFRSGAQLGYSVKKWKYAVFFGQFCVVAPESVGKVLHVGGAAEFFGAAKQW